MPKAKKKNIGGKKKTAIKTIAQISKERVDYFMARIAAI